MEHWLNDKLVLRYDITSSEAAAGMAASKFKDVAGYADKIRTPILLQDHNTVVWFRNLKIHELPATGSAESSSGRAKQRGPTFFLLTLSQRNSEFIRRDVLRRHDEFVQQHVASGFDHHRRSADVVIGGVGIGVL